MNELRTGIPLAANQVTLVPIERFFVRSSKSDRGYWFDALKEPYAIVVCDANGIRAFDTEAIEISLASLKQRIKGLEAMLTSLGY
jgi:hypothetical protein